MTHRADSDSQVARAFETPEQEAATSAEPDAPPSSEAFWEDLEADWQQWRKAGLSGNQLWKRAREQDKRVEEELTGYLNLDAPRGASLAAVADQVGRRSRPPLSLGRLLRDWMGLAL